MAALAIVLLVLFLFRPGVYALRNRIAASIGSALGRRVAIDNVRLRALPRPGFDLEGLVIYDDPSFSAEPMIRAQEVSAAIRFRSLLRGRLEIATLSASEPSINLVRNSEGRWNLTSLLERNAQIPAAPTEKASSERRPAFPYLEASNARVNFKIGQTKKSYALVDADVALWQDSDNSWSARIKAEPIRTDFNLTDTGLLQINATWQRATNLRLTPLRIAVQWQKGQLGQITQLLSGKDRGWRGGVNFNAALTGTPEALKINSRVEISDFHRFDILGSENVRLATACSGQYNNGSGLLSDLLCESPVGAGKFQLRGTVTPFTPAPTYDLALTAERIPLASALRWLRQSKKQIPVGLTATGFLDAQFRATSGISRDNGNSGSSSTSNSALNASRQWMGSGAVTDVLISNNLDGAATPEKREIAIATIPLNLVSANSPANARESRSARLQKKEPQKDQEPDTTYLRVGPITLPMKTTSPVNAGGWVSAAGYRFFLRGDMELKDLFRVEQNLGLASAYPAAEGSVKLDMSVAGAWQGFAPPVATGTAQLRNVKGGILGFNAPIEIASANLTLDANAMSLQRISARIDDSHWSGSVTAPRHCASPPCNFQFDLAADQLSTQNLAEWFTPHPAKRPWYRSSNSAQPSGPSPLLGTQAHGTLHVSHFGLKKLFAIDVITQTEVDRGQIKLSDLRCKLLQGSHQGNWTIDASSSPLRYHGSGALQDISLTQVASLMNDSWISGVADGKFEFDGAGDTMHDLLAGSNGKLQFTMRNGSLPHIQFAAATGPASIRKFDGEFVLSKGVWELSAGRLETRDGTYRTSGTVSSNSGLEFIITRSDNQSWAVTGTLDKTHIAPMESVKR